MVKIKHEYFIGAIPIMPGLSSLWIMGLRIYGEWRTQIPLSSPATIGQGSRIDRAYTDIKLLTILRLITKWYPLLIIIMLFLVTDSPQKLKLGNIHDTLIILFYVSPSSRQLQILFIFY